MLPVKHTIFIVDDDADDRDAIRDAFLQSRQSQDFGLISNGDDLLKQLRTGETHPALILLDLNMPGKDGKTVLREIKADNELKHIPVIVLTTSSSSKEKSAVYKLGANCFVTKPDTFTQFVKITDSIASLWLNAS